MVCFQFLEDKLSISILKFTTSCLSNLHTKLFPQHLVICTGHTHPACPRANLSNTAFQFDLIEMTCIKEASQLNTIVSKIARHTLLEVLYVCGR